jgi:hypothetical protein
MPPRARCDEAALIKIVERAMHHSRDSVRVRTLITSKLDLFPVSTLVMPNPWYLGTTHPVLYAIDSTVNIHPEAACTETSFFFTRSPHSTSPNIQFQTSPQDHVAQVATKNAVQQEIVPDYQNAFIWTMATPGLVTSLALSPITDPDSLIPKRNQTKPNPGFSPTAQFATICNHRCTYAITGYAHTLPVEPFCTTTAHGSSNGPLA